MRRTILLLLAMSANASGQPFVGASGGIATLSADGAKTGSPATAFSMYKPENGATAVLFGGHHFSDWWSVQASYGWNRNTVLLSAGTTGPQPSGYDFPVRTTMHTVVAEAMLYFRRRDDWIRPYLSAGPGVTRISGESDGAASIRGAIALPAQEFDSTGVCFRVAVGMDVRLRRGLALRYSFSETLQSNTISRQLLPRGQRKLANFQNLWGLAWSF